MKMALRRKNDEFFVIPQKNVLSVMDPVNQLGTLKLWAIAHENGPKSKNDEFLVTPLKHVKSVMDLVNQPGIPKLWAIAHENGHERKNDDFLPCLSNMYRVSWPLKITPEPQNCGQWLMKMALRHKNDEFFVIPQKNVLSVMDPVNQPGILKLWAIAHENGPKSKNDEFLVTPLKHVKSVMDLVNQPGIPKLWAIAHENGHERKNDDFLPCLSNMYRVSWPLKITPELQNCGQ
jgi:hypothetical protein